MSEGTQAADFAESGPTVEGIVREAIEGAVCRVFERARETTDEIEGGTIPLEGRGLLWLHTTPAIDLWLRERLAYELAETVPGLVEHAVRALRKPPGQHREDTPR